MRYTALTILLVIGSLNQESSQQVYHLDSNRQMHDLRSFTYALVDSFDHLRPENIIAGIEDENFRPYSVFPKKIENLKAYWLKVKIQSLGAARNLQLILRDSSGSYLNGATNDYVDSYSIDQQTGKIDHQRTGAAVRRSEKRISENVPLNRVAFSSKGKNTFVIYLRIYNRYGAPPELFYPILQDLSIPVPKRSGMFDMMCAIAFLFSLLSFFFFFFVKDKAYLWFAFYTFTLSQHYLILHPQLVFVDWYIPEHPWLAFPMFMLLTSANMALFLLFGRSFINLRSISIKIDRFVKWLILAFAVVSLVAISLTIGLRKPVIAPWHTVAFMAITFCITIRFAFFRSVEAKIFVAGGIWMYGFSLLGMMWNFHLVTLPFNPWAVAQLGILIIYSLGLAYKIRLNEIAKAEAHRIYQLDEIKSRFFANISHEFRTPLTLIQGPLQQIEDQLTDAERQKGEASVPLRQISTMRRNTDRLLELVNQLLDLSRLDSGKMRLQIVKGDALNLLKSLAASFDSMAERKHIHYHLHFAEEPAVVFFDSDKLEKIFTNLLGNAFKYTPVQGTVAVTVETEDDRLRISVEDTGPGIAKKELDKVFDRFYQVEGSEEKGSGIGLALVKELVDLYRGQITVNSDPGKGSRFRVSLPIDKFAFNDHELVYGEWNADKNALTETNRGSNQLEYFTIEDDNSSRRTTNPAELILIVEDNYDLRRFIVETIGSDYEVIEAKNGKEGLDKAFSEIPDAIISDVMMPLMNGFEMTETLKKDERTSHIPVILLTAKAGHAHKIEGLETGADDYLVKPFHAKELLVRIENLLLQRKLLRQKFAGTIQLKPSELSVKSIDQQFLTNVMEAIENNMGEEEFGVEELAKEVAMSRSQLHRKLIAIIDQSPSDLIRKTRLLRAQELLQKKAFSPSEVAFKVGFNSHTYFSKCFKKEFGINPGEVQKSV